MDEMRDHQAGHRILIHQDGAVAMRDFFLENDIEWAKFPSYSPDLNPIENLFAHIKRMIHGHPDRNTNGLEML
ncbi:hypothetical protein Ciccas_013236 [Cichlidogyrus casuarinus]|uniref:Tc1-like transposase DDE domain-containing protein n=1 Tax=Cichlidogyrus casuarinus TaxID=1844966 RepID=A0ABD2PL46_9PLAT